MVETRNTDAPTVARFWPFFVGLALLTVVVYGQVATFSFVNFDDPEYITENRFVRQGLTLEGVEWAFTTNHASNWHPLTWLSLMLDAELFSQWAGGYHLTNALFHLANVELIFLWLLLWTRSPWPSAFVAALFAVHPQHAESVAWVTERKDVLSTFFGLLAILAYGHFLTHRTFGRSLAILLAYSLSLLAKQMFVTLPVLLLLLDIWPLQRWNSRNLRDAGRLVFEKLPVFVLGGLFSAIVFYVQRTGGTVSDLAKLPLDLRIRNGIYSTAVYLYQTFIPSGLAFYYPHPLDRLTNGQVGVAALVLGLVSILAAITWRRRPFLLVGWLWYLVTLAPVIGIIQIGKQGMADRYVYVPHIGIFVMVAWGIRSLLTSPRLSISLVRAAGLLIIGIYAVIGFIQIGTWQDSRALAKRALAVTTQNSMALQVMGESYMTEKNAGAALPYFAEAERIVPYEETVLSSLGLALELLGNVDEALEKYRLAAKHHPKSERSLNNLGRILVERGAVAEGIVLYRRVLDFKPDSVVVNNNLAQALVKQGDIAAANRQFELALSLDPTNTKVRTNYAIFLVDHGKTTDGIHQLREAIRQNPTDVELRGNLGALLARAGDLDGAMNEFRGALAIDPEAASIRAKLGRAYLGKGEIDAALAEYRRTLAEDPKQGDALNDLGWILATSTKYRNGAEAVKLLAFLTKESKAPDVLDTYAAALAAAGDFVAANQVAKKAADIARAAGNVSLAEQIEARATLYQSGQPYRDPSLP